MASWTSLSTACLPKLAAPLTTTTYVVKHFNDHWGWALGRQEHDYMAVVRWLGLYATHHIVWPQSVAFLTCVTWEMLMDTLLFLNPVLFVRRYDLCIYLRYCECVSCFCHSRIYIRHTLQTQLAPLTAIPQANSSPVSERRERERERREKREREKAKRVRERKRVGEREREREWVKSEWERERQRERQRERKSEKGEI